MKSVLALGITLFIGVTSCSACGFNPKFEPSLDSDQPRGKMVSSQTIQTMPIKNTTESIEDSVESQKYTKQIDANDPSELHTELSSAFQGETEKNQLDNINN